MEKTKKEIVYSIVIPLVSEPVHLETLLESLEIQHFNPEIFEWIFVQVNVNYPYEKTIGRFVEKHPEWKIRLVKTQEKSLLAARNLGIEHANGKILLFFEDDIIFHKDYFHNLVQETSHLPDKAFVGGGKIIPVFEQQKPPWIIKFFRPLLAEVNLKEKYKIFPKKKYPFGINMLVHQKVFEKTGLFDPSPELKHGEEHIVQSEKIFVDKARRENIPVYYFSNLLVWNYIPPKQLSRKYIRKQAEISLQMELEKVKQKGNVSLGKFIFRELLKYLATFGMGFYYLITTQWEKLKSLFQFRYWSFKLMWKNFSGKS